MSVTYVPDAGFWRDKRVLLTGHTGFKGAWLALWLNQLGARVTGISLPPATQPNLYSVARVDEVVVTQFCDVRDAKMLARVVADSQPQIVLHLAAQALVRAGYRDPVHTFDVNVMGTVNILDALRATSGVRVVVAITTDKVYRNLEQSYPFREDDALGGHDPYSASKAAAEIVIASYRDSFFAASNVALASARAGNVIGGGDWAEDRLIPDAVRAWSAGQILQVRRPRAVRPWQHVLEPLAGYMALAQKLWSEPGLAASYNFGPLTHEAATVREVVELAYGAYGNGRVAWGDGTDGPHEAGWLALEISKARAVLGVAPRWNLREAVERTMRWYGKFAAGGDARALCEADIASYGRAA